jgi:formylmethanofuran:tetrahydromethanopterin formyltransferase
MTVHEAIAALNDVSTEKIKTLTTRDGREIADLPRVGREVIIRDSSFNKNVKVTPADIAWLCEEARLAMAPAQALLNSALDALKAIEGAAT